ncbi:zinc finger protein 662-like isoform X2 [Hyperolius riggenbachi]|uniref:zinc finger protein 662-like isoform X2 n=1 Tax=Hyperolius riggenbachi TaxID=752182 RepID=UPI0035A369E0
MLGVLSHAALSPKAASQWHRLRALPQPACRALLLRAGLGLPGCASGCRQEASKSSPGETVCFSVEELDSLEEREKQSYLYVKPETVSKVHSGEELCVKSDLYKQRRKNLFDSFSDNSLNKEVHIFPNCSSREDEMSQRIYSTAQTLSRPCRKQRKITCSPPEGSMLHTDNISSTRDHHCISGTVERQSDQYTAIYTCSKCGDNFNKHSDFLNHQATHVEDKNSEVKYDNSVRHKKVHITNHTGIHLREKKHVIYNSTAVRQKRVQAEPKSFICQECGKSFTQNASLVVHKRTHTGERPHTCKICLKSFISGSYLVMHHRVHTGERPYVCNDCGKRFISSSNLIIHQRVHTGEKPYLCTECGKCFGHSSHLVRHQKVHTGERPFTCAECGKAFSRSSHLVRHQTIHMRGLAN